MALPSECENWYMGWYIAEKIGKVNYRLRDLKSHAAIKNVVHANRLRPYHNPNLMPTNIPSGIEREVIQIEMD